MIGFDEAIELMSKAVRPLPSEEIALDRAVGRVLATAVDARVSSPATDVSAMDGYALREEDLDKFPARLSVVGESFPGHGWTAKIGAGQCVRIFTGASVPAGANRIVIQENVSREGDLAVITQAPGHPRHIRPMGSDFRAGETLLGAGTLINAGSIVAAAAADHESVEVHRRPRVIILATGDELAEPGHAAGTPGAIPESASFGIAAVAEQWGAKIVGRSLLKDDLECMESAASDALSQADVTVVTGGASVGERDFAKAMFAPASLSMLFSKVAIKPGKPVWLGHSAGKLVLGLPGNPTSAMVTARLFLAPLLAMLSGRDGRSALSWRPTLLDGQLDECGPRETFHRARWEKGAVTLISNQDSGAQRALVEAGLLLRQRAGSPAQIKGSWVDVLDFP